MRVRGTIKQKSVVILIDFSGTHNLVNSNFANKIGLLDENDTKLHVIVANDERVTSFGRCGSVEIFTSRGGCEGSPLYPSANCM